MTSLTSIHIEPFELPLVKFVDVEQPLYPHQALLYKQSAFEGVTVVEAKTGTGKTRAAIMPAIARGDSVVAVYPTNALVDDQTRAVLHLFEETGRRTIIQLPDSDPQEVARAEHCLVPVDARLLDEWQHKLRTRNHSEALEGLLTADKKSRVLLTNPDTLYSILALKFRAGVAAQLGHFNTLVMDEFHLYTGVELANALYLIHFARELKAFRRTLVLSATLSEKVATLIGQLFGATTVRPDVEPVGSVIGSRTCTHAITLQPHEALNGTLEAAFDAVTRSKKGIEKDTSPAAEERHFPIVVILNSVVHAIWLRDKLVDAKIYQPDEILEIRGLSNKAIRKFAGQRIVIGTSSITVGVDFDASILVFEASDAAEFIQRLGRLGRHRPGLAVFLCEPRIAEQLNRLDGQRLTRDDLEIVVYGLFPKRLLYEDFPRSKWGLLTSFTVGENIRKRITDHPGLDPDGLQRSLDFVGQVEHGYVEKLDAQKEATAASRLTRLEWYRTFTEAATFRSSMPNLEMVDWREVERRAGNISLGSYEADLKTVLQRGVGLQFNSQMGKWLVRGYGAYSPVGLSFAAVSDGHVLPITDDRVKNWQFKVKDRGVYLLSELFGGPHIFAVARGETRDQVDWRIGCFPCGEHLVGFDGAGLVLRFIDESLPRRA